MKIGSHGVGSKTRIDVIDAIEGIVSVFLGGFVKNIVTLKHFACEKASFVFSDLVISTQLQYSYAVRTYLDRTIFVSAT